MSEVNNQGRGPRRYPPRDQNNDGSSYQQQENRPRNNRGGPGRGGRGGRNDFDGQTRQYPNNNSGYPNQQYQNMGAQPQRPMPPPPLTQALPQPLPALPMMPVIQASLPSVDVNLLLSI